MRVLKLQAYNCAQVKVLLRLGGAAASQVFLFLYRDPPALRQVSAASVHLPARRGMMSVLVNVNRHVGSHVMCKAEIPSQQDNPPVDRTLSNV